MLSALFIVVPEAGLEPARCCHRQILSYYLWAHSTGKSRFYRAIIWYILVYFLVSGSIAVVFTTTKSEDSAGYFGGFFVSFRHDVGIDVQGGGAAGVA